MVEWMRVVGCHQDAVRQSEGATLVRGHTLVTTEISSLSFNLIP